MGKAFTVVGLVVGVLIATARMSKVRIKGAEVIVGGMRIPLAGAVARVHVNQFGAGGRHFTTVMTIIGADGELAVASFGAGFGQKAKSNRREHERVQRLAARINSASGPRQGAVKAPSRNGMRLPAVIALAVTG